MGLEVREVVLEICRRSGGARGKRGGGEVWQQMLWLVSGL